MLRKASITRNQIYQAFLITIKPIFILKLVWSLLQINESASVMLFQTWHRLLLYLYEHTFLSNAYILDLTK